MADEVNAPPIPPTGRSPSRHPAYYHALLEALAQPGCAVCRLAADAADRYLSTWIYETFTDAGNRAILVRARGFCTRHTWAIAESHAAFQLAVAYETVLGDVLREPAAHLMPGVRSDTWWRRLLDRRSQTGKGAKDEAAALEEAIAARWRTCPACRVRAETERNLLGAFAACVTDDAFRAAFSASNGLCLWHFRPAYAVCAAAQSPEVAAWLEGAERDCLGRVAGLMKEMIRKHDYRFRDEPQGDEMRSWQLAAELVAGRHGLW